MPDIRSLVNDAVGDLHGDPDAYPQTMRRVRARQRRRRIGAAAAALVLTVGGAWLVWRSFDSPPGRTPAAEPTGRVLFTMQRSGDPMPLVAVMAIDGSELRVLGPGNEPAWSPDGRQIAFTRSADDGSTGIFVMDSDGQHVRRLTTNPSGLDEGPSWSPDGISIVFSRVIFERTNPDPVASRARRDVYSVSVLDATLAKVIGGSTDDFAPDWSPDGSLIGFVRISDPESTGSAGTPQIWTARPDGSLPVKVTSLEHGPFRFDWSPDGSTLVLDVSCKLYFLQLGSGDVSRMSLTSRVSCPFDASWSPDGSRVMFTGGHGDHDLFVANADGTNVIRLTGAQAQDNEGSWLGGP